MYTNMNVLLAQWPDVSTRFLSVQGVLYLFTILEYMSSVLEYKCYVPEYDFLDPSAPKNQGSVFAGKCKLPLKGKAGKNPHKKLVRWRDDWSANVPDVFLEISDFSSCRHLQ